MRLSSLRAVMLHRQAMSLSDHGEDHLGSGRREEVRSGVHLNPLTFTHVHGT